MTQFLYLSWLLMLTFMSRWKVNTIQANCINSNIQYSHDFSILVPRTFPLGTSFDGETSDGYGVSLGASLSHLCSTVVPLEVCFYLLW